MLLCFLLAAIMSLSTGHLEAATLAELDPAAHYQTAAITITGNHHFSDADLLAVIQTKTRPTYQFWKPRPAFSAPTFKADIDRIKRFYQVHGYYAATAAYKLKIDGKLISAEVSVSEGQPVKVEAVRVIVEGSGPRPKSLEPSFTPPLKPGDNFSQETYESADAQLLDLYMHHGYPHAHVDRRAQVLVGPRKAYVWYVVTPGSYAVFGPTIVRGTKKVSPKLVLRELAYKPGEMFDSGLIAESRTRIVGLNLFRSVEFIFQPN